MDLTARLVEERGWTLELEEVDALMDDQRERARLSWKGSDTAAGGGSAPPESATSSNGLGSMSFEIPMAVRQWEAELDAQPSFLRTTSAAALSGIGGGASFDNSEVTCCSWRPANYV